MAKNSRASLPPILFAKQVINGIKVRPDSRAVLDKAVQGHPIEVRSGSDYINLYHVFERMVDRDRRLSRMRIIRQQIGRARWMLLVLPEGVEPPKAEFEASYNPKRGRYKRYADQLAGGDALVFDEKAEAVKAQRAWRLYYSPKERQGLRGIISSRRGKFVAQAIAHS